MAGRADWNWQNSGNDRSGEITSGNAETAKIAETTEMRKWQKQGS